MYQKRTFDDWVKIVNDVFNIPERIDTFSIVELKEMLLHLNKRHSYLLTQVIQRVNVETSNSYYGTAQHLEYCRKNCLQYGYNVIDIENIMNLVKGKIERYNKIIDDPIFEPNIAKDFFEYCIENWVSKTKSKKTALSYIFNQMWHARKEQECQYKIKCNSVKFAEYWNFEYSKKIGLELNVKNPKFKTSTEITTSTYEIEFKRMLDTFSI